MPYYATQVFALALIIGAISGSQNAVAATAPPLGKMPEGPTIVVPETFLITRVLTSGAVPSRHYRVIVEIAPVKLLEKYAPRVTTSSGDAVIDAAAIAFALRSLTNPALRAQLKQRQLVFHFGLNPPRIKPDPPTVIPGQEKSLAENPNIFAPRPRVPLAVRMRRAHGEGVFRTWLEVTYNGVTGRPDRVGIVQGTGKEIFDSTILYWVLTNWINLKPSGSPLTERSFLGVRVF